MARVRFSSDSGQTLVEILVAIAVIILVLVAVVSRAVDSVRNSIFSRDQVLATRFAQEGIEWARSQRDRLGWGEFTLALDGDPVTYCVLNLASNLETLSPVGCADPIPGTIFLREVSFDYEAVADPSGDYADVTAVVSWTDRTGTHASTLGTRLSQWIK